MTVLPEIASVANRVAILAGLHGDMNDEENQWGGLDIDFGPAGSVRLLALDGEWAAGFEVYRFTEHGVVEAHIETHGLDVEGCAKVALLVLP